MCIRDSSWLLGGLSTVLGAAGQLLFRRFGIAQQPQGLSISQVPDGLQFLILGIGCYLVAVVLWVRVLRDLPLSRAYPLLCLSYPLVYLGALAWLQEPLEVKRALGTALVTAGALLAAAPANSGSASARLSKSFESVSR